jgi:thiopeptide-type bacteriocin biosynthesis protein
MGTVVLARHLELATLEAPWLCARLHVRPPHHDAILAEGVPALLEVLPESVPYWIFERHAGRDPNLRLCFCGTPGASWGELLPRLRLCAADLVEAGLLDRLAVEASPAAGRAYREAGQPAAVGHADSAAVLAQVRLAQVEAITVAPAVLAAVGMAELARAFCGETRWTRELTVLWSGAGGSGAPAPAAADEVRQLIDPAVRAGRADWGMLAPSWADRARVVTGHGSGVRRLAGRTGDARLVPRALARLLRAHHNRAVPAGTRTATDTLALLHQALGVA